MNVQEISGLLEYSFLQLLLGWRNCWEVAQPTSCDIILSKGIHQAFANPGGIRQLGW